MSKMKFVFNPKNGQINPATASTLADATLRNKGVSSELYALICQGKITIEDVAAMFAVGKSPECLVKDYKALDKTPQKTAKSAETQLPNEDIENPDGNPIPPGADREKLNANEAWDGKGLSHKNQPELLILARSLGVDIEADGFNPTKANLKAAIKEKAEAAQAKVDDANVGVSNS